MRARFSADLDNFNISSEKWFTDFSRAARLVVGFLQICRIVGETKIADRSLHAGNDAFASTASRAMVCCPIIRASRSRIAALDRIWTITIVATSRTPRPEAMPSLAPMDRLRRKRDMGCVLENNRGNEIAATVHLPQGGITVEGAPGQIQDEPVRCERRAPAAKPQSGTHTAKVSYDG